MFVLARYFAHILSDLRPSLLLPTRLFLWLGPTGWLTIMLLVAILLPAQQMSFRARRLDRALTVALAVALSVAAIGIVCLMVVGEFQPICDFSATLKVE